MGKTKPFGMIYSTGTLRSPAFFIRWQEGKVRRKKSGFTKKADAAAALAEIRTRLDDGTLVARRRRVLVSLDQVATDWLNLYSEPTLKGHKGNVRFYRRHIKPFFKDVPVRAVDSKRLLEFRLRLTKTIAARARPGKDAVPKRLEPSTVNVVLSLLQAILSFAVVQEHLTASPIAKLGRGGYLLKIARKEMQPPVAEAVDVKRLLDAIREAGSTQGSGRRIRNQQLGNPVYPLLATLVYTGMRRGEALGLRWKDVNFDFRIITVRTSYVGTTKSGKERTIPLPDELAPILRSHRMADPWKADLVFTDPNTGKMYTAHSKQPQDRLNAAIRKLNLPHVRVHDLRHIYASFFLMNGGKLDVLQKFLGHSSPVITNNTYAHLSTSYIGAESGRVTFQNASETTRSRPDAKLLSLSGAAGDLGQNRIISASADV